MPTPVAAAVAALFAYGLVTLVYAFRPLIEWDDLFRYVQRFSIDPYYGMQQPQTLIEYPLSEYGWQLIVLAIFESGLSFEASFAGIAMLALGAMAFALIRVSGRPMVLVLFLNPAMIDFVISQVRSALALSIVLLAFTRSLPLALAGIALASTIHTSMLLFAVPLLLDFARRRLGDRLDQTGWKWAMIAFAASVFLAGSQILILDFLGDRRAAYALSDISTGLLLTVAWSGIGLAGFLMARERSGRTMLAAMFLLGMFITSSLLGLYSHRYAAFMVPFLGLAFSVQSQPRASFFAMMGALWSIQPSLLHLLALTRRRLRIWPRQARPHRLPCARMCLSCSERDGRRRGAGGL